MNFTVIDVGGFLLAVAAGVAVLAVPGVALARLAGFNHDPKETDLLTGVVVGLALLPVLDSLLTRFIGLDAALAMNIALCVAALGCARKRTLLYPSRLGLVLAGAWLVLVGIETVDFDIAGKLYQPLSVFDMVKHAATTQAIYDSGAPPRDAFFLRPERASYYYFFYTLGALMMRICGGWLSAKAAFAGMVFWTGVGAYGLVRLALKRSGLDRAVAAARRPALITAVMAAAGLDILAVLFFAVMRHYWIADPLRWNEQVGAWLEDLLWVPHHVTALIAGAVGLIALCDVINETADTPAQRRHLIRATIVAGLCFASSLGLSVWVTLGFVLTMAVWAVLLASEKRWRPLSLVLAAGLATLLIAVPQIADLKAGRAGDGQFPVIAMIRAFLLVEEMVPERFQPIANLVSLPLSYALEFGVLALGAVLFWRRRDDVQPAGREFRRLLTIMAIVGLGAGAVLRSYILNNNDLGWRVTLLPLLSGTVWTIVVVDRWLAKRGSLALQTSFCALFVLGWATVVYTAVLMRAYPFTTINPKARFIAENPAAERALREAFGWASANLPRSAVLQQNPTFRRAFAFGMYGSNPVGVADSFASLYGADPKAVAARLESIGPIFKVGLPVSEIAARAAANGIDDLVVTAADPIWSQPDSFVWRVKPVYSAPMVRIIPVNVLEAAR